MYVLGMSVKVRIGPLQLGPWCALSAWIRPPTGPTVARGRTNPTRPSLGTERC